METKPFKTRVKPNPCFYCKSKNVVVRSNHVSYWVECNGCGARGPAHHMLDEETEHDVACDAVSRWNGSLALSLLDQERFVEEVAAQAHEVWKGWVTDVLERGRRKYVDDRYPLHAIVLPGELVRLFEYQVATNYQDLSESEKHHARELAIRILKTQQKKPITPAPPPRVSLTDDVAKSWAQREAEKNPLWNFGEPLPKGKK